MALSLTQLHLRFGAMLFLAAAAAGYGMWQLLIEVPRADSQETLSALARAAVAQIDGQLERQRSMMRYIVAQSAPAPGGWARNTGARRELEARARGGIPHAKAAYLIVDRSAGARTDGERELPQTCANHPALGGAAAARARPHFHEAPGVGPHYDLVEAIQDRNGAVEGYLMMSFAAAPLADTLARTLKSSGAYELRQSGAGTVVVAQGGDTIDPSRAAAIESTVGNSGWTFVLTRADAAIRYDHARLLPWLALCAGALAAILLAGLRLWRRSVRLVRHDVMSLLRMFKDVRDGTMRVDYPMRLKDFAEAFLYLRTSGRKMLNEKRKLKDMGLIDHLSQLSNRRHFEMRLKELFELSKTHGASAVLIIDVDHFKQVNDVHGHDAGDALIVGIANALRRCVRQTDLLARLGGDEFCIIYPYTKLDSAVAFAERLRRELPREIPLTKGVNHELRWTAGISAFSEKDSKFDDVLWRADQALLQAKEEGRNTLRVFDPTKGLNKKAPMAAN